MPVACADMGIAAADNRARSRLPLAAILPYKSKS